MKKTILILLALAWLVTPAVAAQYLNGVGLQSLVDDTGIAQADGYGTNTTLIIPNAQLIRMGTTTPVYSNWFDADGFHFVSGDTTNLIADGVFFKNDVVPEEPTYARLIGQDGQPLWTLDVTSSDGVLIHYDGISDISVGGISLGTNASVQDWTELPLGISVTQTFLDASSNVRTNIFIHGVLRSGYTQ